MSRVNPRDKTILCKVVYYGPGLGGKTTSLQAVHSVLDPEDRVKLISLKTDEERTLFFDFLPIDLGLVGGYRIKLQTFTVPGQVQYNMTRKYLLMGADGIVFVADSQHSRFQENVASIENLTANLAAEGQDLADLPCVIQFNKRDLPQVTPIAAMQAALVQHNIPFFATCASTGEGVFEAFTELARRIVSRVVAQHDQSENAAEISERAARFLLQLQTSQQS